MRVGRDVDDVERQSLIGKGRYRLLQTGTQWQSLRSIEIEVNQLMISRTRGRRRI